MSQQTGIPLSTIAKVERNELTLTYDKLQQISDRIGIPLSELFAANGREIQPTVTARRSIGTVDNALHIKTAEYDYTYLCTELRRKRMVPILMDLRTRSIAEFGEAHHHRGEEFAFVVRGRVKVITEFYDPVELEAGQSIYFDATMGHAFLLADNCEDALILCVMSSADEDLMEGLKAIK